MTTNNNIKKRGKTSREKIKERILSLLVRALAWCGVAVVYYFIFSIFFDTPLEYEMRKTNRTLRNQYEILSAKLDTLEAVSKNLSTRDVNLYSAIFEANPYDNSSQNIADSYLTEQELLALSNNELSELFFDKLKSLENGIKSESKGYWELQKNMDSLGEKLNYFPSIQPIVNKDFSKLAASYGMRIQPFLKTVSLHEGVDFAIPEDSRIYATADGTVKSVAQGSKGEGLTIDIDHKNGYITTYSHLNKSLVRRYQKIKRGDIIAYSGNSGLSFLPHLHYSVSYNGLKVDPINYFFMELNPYESVEIKRRAENAMQSLD
ncbi:MAG: M23 family metallopeptidase [Rikenellaceae bacterium]